MVISNIYNNACGVPALLLLGAFGANADHKDP
jgi:hypothetical protein